MESAQPDPTGIPVRSAGPRDSAVRPGLAVSRKIASLKVRGMYCPNHAMRAVAASLLLAAAVAGCASTGTGGDGLDSPVSSPPSEESQLYSAALHQLVLVDNPFARSPSPVGYVFVVDGSQFDTDLKNDITAQSGDLPSVEFIASPDQRADVGRQGLTGVENDGVIIELDPTQRQDDGRPTPAYDYGVASIAESGSPTSSSASTDSGQSPERRAPLPFPEAWFLFGAPPLRRRARL